MFWGGALAVGVSAVLFARAADLAQTGFSRLMIYPWLALAITPAGFALSALLCRTWFPGAQGSGIPQAIAARHFRDSASRNRLLSLRLSAGKVLLTLLGLLCGASIGREGPTVQVGASLMLQVANWSRMGRERGLIVAGSAAGIAAAFNTPLAGIVFAIEEMSRAFELRTSGIVLFAVILAGLASLGMLGNYRYFGETHATLAGVWDWLAIVYCGVGGGALGGLFTKLVLDLGARIQKRLATASLRESVGFAALCGLVVAIAGLLSGGTIYGTGYEQARHAVEGGSLGWSFAPLKFIATLASTLSGIPGGLFAPSLSVGAGLGAIISALMHSPSAGAIVVLAMAGYFAGVVQAPITAFVIILEMTADQDMVIPLMMASMLGFGTARLFNPDPLYHALAHRFIDKIEAENTANAAVSNG